MPLQVAMGIILSPQAMSASLIVQGLPIVGSILMPLQAISANLIV